MQIIRIIITQTVMQTIRIYIYKYNASHLHLPPGGVGGVSGLLRYPPTDAKE